MLNYDEFGEVIEAPAPGPAPSGVTLSDEQDRVVYGILQALKRGQREITLGGYAGTGKMLAIDTAIPTPSGWSTMGDIREGDVVFDERGKPVTVTAANPIEEAPRSFRIRFDDGEEVLACADHLWWTFNAKELHQLTKRTEKWRADRRAKRPSRSNGRATQRFIESLRARNSANPPSPQPPPTGAIRTTAEIAATLTIRNGTRANHAIPVALPLDLPDLMGLPLDPYLLGVWLGDGSTSAGSITTADPEIEQAFAAIFTLGAKHEQDGNRAWTRYVKGLRIALKNAGVFGNKHIPTTYLRASGGQRLSLLQGLMDTDGTVARSGSVEFTTTKKALAVGVRELVCSLGWKARVVEGVARLNGVDISPKWDLTWTPSEYVFRLPRKRCLQKLATRRTTRFRYVVACDEIAPVPMRCIAVSSPSRLYLAGRGMIPTHNTTTVRFLLEGLRNWAVCAFTGKAANVLRRKGIEAKTIHSLIYVPYEDKDGIKYRLRDGLDCAGILVDEASMVGADICRDLRSFHLPMIFVGDHGQLEPVGSAVNLMAEPQFTLETIHRNAGDIAVFAESLRLDRPLVMHNDQVDVRSHLQTSVACEADQVICAYNRARVNVNALIRKALGFADCPAGNDRAMCLRNNRELGLYNGQQGTITGIRAVRKSHYLDFECEGTVYPAVWYDPDQFGKERVESNGRLNVQTPLPFDYAYCVTAHKAQGDEWDTVVVIEQRCDYWEHRRWAYTAASRARKRLIWIAAP